VEFGKILKMPYKDPAKFKELNFLFKEIIDRIMIADILRLKELDPLLRFHGSEYYGGRGTTPMVLYIFVCMEFLGSLIMEVEAKGSGSTQKKVLAYMEMTFGPDMDLFITHRRLFIKFYRNALAHGFFPGGGGISRGGSQVLGVTARGDLILDADILQICLLGRCGVLNGYFVLG